MQQMRPFSPQVEDIDMYLEEAKERGLHIPNQDQLRRWADRVNKHNLDIVKRDEKAIQENRLKKAYDEDIKKEEEKKKREDAAYKRYLYEFDKKNKTGQYKPVPPLTPAYHGWEPRIWSTGGVEVQPKFEENSYSLSDFDIVVESISKTSFPANFPPIDTTWADSNKTGDITSVKFDITDPYFSSLTGAYKLFCLTGFSQQHLDSKDPFVKSLCYYFAYYWMSIFQRNPVTVSQDVEDYLQKHHPTKKTWTKKFHQGQKTPTWWMKRQPEYKQGRIRNAKPAFGTAGRRFGQAGIDYEEVTYVGPKGKDDWLQLIPKTSTGFTKLGQEMFQQSLESFVFCILDSQAKTGWSITNQGAKSYQTHDVFRKLVQDTIKEHDVTVTINNMKKAISATGVSLNFALIPRTILIPSDMRLQTKIPGFNNLLTLVNTSMHFGKNTDVNKRITTEYSNKQIKKDASTNQKDQVHSEKTDLHQNKREKSNHPSSTPHTDTNQNTGDSVIVEVIGGVVAGLFLRFLMYLL